MEFTHSVRARLIRLRISLWISVRATTNSGGRDSHCVRDLRLRLSSVRFHGAFNLLRVLSICLTVRGVVSHVNVLQFLFTGLIVWGGKSRTLRLVRVGDARGLQRFALSSNAPRVTYTKLFLKRFSTYT